MARALAAAVPIEAGIIAAPTRGESRVAQLEWIQAGHPSPDEQSIRAGSRALELARASSGDDVLVVLLSGGASSLLCAPVDGVTAAEKAEAADALMRSGARIDEINCVRKHLSRLKGGRLGIIAARTVTFALSDVHGPIADDPAVIGSGPTVADPTTYGDAVRVLRDRAVRVPASVEASLERGRRGEADETPKPGDPRLRRACYVLLGNRHTALEGALRAAQQCGYQVFTLPEATTGEARDAAHAFLAEVRWIAKDAPRPLCVLAAGETTVRVTGDGRGGRNQEFALAAASAIGSFGRAAVLASAGTDGIDGPTDAAGAIVDSTTVERATRAGIDARAALERNDAYSFFEPLNDLIRWGPTGTNVGDVQVMLIA
jgi:glycerate 2-kinase